MSSTERAAATRARQRAATDAYWAAKVDVTAVLGHIARLGMALARGDLTQAKKIHRVLRKGAGKLAAHWPHPPTAWSIDPPGLAQSCVNVITIATKSSVVG
jgi:hypothetical protein